MKWSLSSSASSTLSEDGEMLNYQVRRVMMCVIYVECMSGLEHNLLEYLAVLRGMYESGKRKL